MLNLDSILENIKQERDGTHDCKGLVFRCQRSAFISGNEDITEVTRLRLLKKKSCKLLRECETCSFWFDLFGEEIDLFKENGIPCSNILKDGKLYRPVGHSWQTFEGDYDFEWEFVEIKEANNE
ncbi:MAG: hypothetical protein WC503_01140 [Candidatus Shapirobacteria bacterium]